MAIETAGVCGREDFQKWVVAGLISGCGGVATLLRLGFVYGWRNLTSGYRLCSRALNRPFLSSSARRLSSGHVLPLLHSFSSAAQSSSSLNAAEALPQQARGSSCLLGIITLNVTNDLLLDRRFPLSSFSGAFIPAWEHGVVRLAQLAFARTLYDSIVRSS